MFLEEVHECMLLGIQFTLKFLEIDLFSVVLYSLPPLFSSGPKYQVTEKKLRERNE